MDNNTSVLQMFNLTGRTAVITGGAGFLGLQHAEALLEAGASVVLWDLTSEKLTECKSLLQKKFSAKIRTALVDISNQEQIAKATEELVAEFGHLDILINNASLTVARGAEKFKGYFDAFEDYPKELWQMALDVNLTGTFMVTQALIPALKKSGNASIVNIASDVGVISPDHRIYGPNSERGYEGVGFNTPLSYAVSKAALIHMTKYWATYWAKSGIRVNSLSPAGVENAQDPKFKRELCERIPMGRMAKPHEYKGAILFLASDASSFMTGANLIIDGGRTAW